MTDLEELEKRLIALEITVSNPLLQDNIPEDARHEVGLKEKIEALEDVLVHTDSDGNRIPLKQANRVKQFSNRLELYTKANNDLWGQSKTRIEELEAKLNALIKTHNALNIPRVLGNLADSIVKIKQRLEALEKHHDDSKIYEHKKDIDKLYEEPTKKPEHDCENCKKLSSCVDIEVQRGDWGNCLEYEPIATAEQTMCLNWNYAKNSASHRCVSQGFKPSEYVLKSEVVQRIYKLKEKYNSVGVLKILLKELSEK